MSKNKVSVSNAAKMAGVSRATFYRHIDEKSISTEQDSKGNKVVDLSELIRVYGESLKTLEQVETEKTASQNKNETARDTGQSDAELAILREKLRALEEERERERTQLSSQIDDLRERLEKTEDQRIKSEEQKDRLTLMLTDQRGDKEKSAAEIKMTQEKFNALENMLKNMKAEQDKLLQAQEAEQGKGFFKRLFG